MIISIDSEKAFEENLTSILVKNFKIVGIKWAYFNIIKAIYDKPTNNKPILNSKNLIVSPLRLETRERYSGHCDSSWY